jgi:predicted RNase H-like nuclease (RuvC/YqgF family)
MKDVAESLKTLARIEAQNSALAHEFKQLREETIALRKEVADIQRDMPALLQIKAGAATGVRMILIAVFVAVLALAGLKITH